MKLYKSFIIASAFALGMTSCTDWLEQEPVSQISPEGFMTTQDRIEAAANALYTSVLPNPDTWSYGIYAWDNETDNQTDWTPDDKYGTGLWKVGSTNDNWSWTNIRNINYWLNEVETQKTAGNVQGSEADINQALGEFYFLRAYEYFKRLQQWGDLPIIKEAMPDDEAMLVAASNRKPCNEVARFILEDLDKAISMLKTDADKRHTRIGRDAALVLKSRVALFEGSWLKNFKGTAFVPNGTGWPGAEKDYNKGYQFPSGSIDAEANYFFTEAAKAAETVAEKYKNSLVKNTGTIPQKEGDAINPYFAMWGTIDMSGTPEVLLWREYSNALGITNCVEVSIQHGNYGVGLTRSFVESYLMKDGRPIYASQYAYDDNSMEKVAKDRDPRLAIFLKLPGQKNWYKNANSSADHDVEDEPNPDITNHVGENGYTTGYTIRKGGTFDKNECHNGGCANALCVFRATEALLNYIEAQYELTGDINSGHIVEYWTKVREAAGFTGEATDPMVTINATDMSKETLDWGAYTAGQVLTDKVLYNIRRERRSELIAEGLREMDLKRWRALDQLIDTPYHVEGMKLWNSEMTGWYDNMVSDGSNSANVSSPTLSNYLRPHEVNMEKNNFKDGLTWHMAHYLQPLPIRQFLLTAADHATISESPLYQNPYWPTTAGEAAEK